VSPVSPQRVFSHAQRQLHVVSALQFQTGEALAVRSGAQDIDPRLLNFGKLDVQPLLDS
jgi:hypothetical protein